MERGLILDTTDHFEMYAERKCGDWDELPIWGTPNYPLTDEDQRLLSLKRRFITNRRETPNPFKVNVTQNNLPQEFVVEMLGGEDIEYYYVDTQGYDYARYTFRYLPRPLEH